MNSKEWNRFGEKVFLVNREDIINSLSFIRAKRRLPITTFFGATILKTIANETYSTRIYSTQNVSDFLCRKSKKFYSLRFTISRISLFAHIHSCSDGSNYVANKKRHIIMSLQVLIWHVRERERRHRKLSPVSLKWQAAKDVNALNSVAQLSLFTQKAVNMLVT